MNIEPDRRLQDSELELSGCIYGHCPVQAQGAVRGRSFYFRAKHDEWSFSLAMRPDTESVDICSSAQGFYRSGSYGKAHGRGPDAGWMPYDEVEQIIRRCIDEYLQTTVT
ncbi:MAG TPA: hypothetical protein VN887_11920 [Candidatus Angelobacter sp.]|nr:hypothetical protein [Candidatus Angelobacter sp.]